MKTSLVSLVLALVLPVAAHATVSLAPLFRDHAVLQRDKPVPVWGAAAPGEHVAVSFRGDRQRPRRVRTADGRCVSTRSLRRPIPRIGRLRGNRGGRPRCLVGEVWLCSGQSNMQFTVWDPTGTASGW